MRATAGLVLAIAASLAAFGCGGGDDSTTSQSGQGEALSKSQFIARADAICRRYNARIAPLEAKFTELQRQGLSGARLSQGADLLRQDASLAQQEEADLRELQPPADDASTIERWLTSGEATALLANKIADAFESGDSEAISSFSAALNTQGTKTGRIVEGYGFEVCNQG
jgi:hypothetical protein